MLSPAAKIDVRYFSRNEKIANTTDEFVIQVGDMVKETVHKFPHTHFSAAVFLPAARAKDYVCSRELLLTIGTQGRLIRLVFHYIAVGSDYFQTFGRPNVTIPP